MLAIVIPYYKLTFFQATLDSLANQTNKNFKVYIGDDASPENPVDLLENYKEIFDFDYVKFDVNLGGSSLTSQWTRCIDLIADEQWIMILGDDDTLENSVVDSFYQHHDRFVTKSNLVRFATKLIFEVTEKLSKKYEHPLWEPATDSFFRKYDATSRSSLSEYVFRKEVYLKYGFHDFPLAWSSDDHAWLEFSDHKPIYTINESLVFIRISTINISGKTDNAVLKNTSEIQFFKYLIANKLQYYNANKKLRILNNYENKINVFRKITFRERLFIFYFYCKYINFEMLRLSAKSIAKKIKK